MRQDVTSRSDDTSGSGVQQNLRQCSIPELLAYAILGKESGRLVTVTERSIQRWDESAGEKLAEQSGDGQWKHVKPIDLRRSWADILLTDGIPSPVVMQWGGWGDYESFQKTYLSRHKISSSLEMASQSRLFD